MGKPLGKFLTHPPYLCLSFASQAFGHHNSVELVPPDLANNGSVRTPVQENKGQAANFTGNFNSLGQVHTHHQPHQTIPGDHVRGYEQPEAFYPEPQDTLRPPLSYPSIAAWLKFCDSLQN